MITLDVREFYCEAATPIALEQHLGMAYARAHPEYWLTMRSEGWLLVFRDRTPFSARIALYEVGGEDAHGGYRLRRAGYLLPPEVETGGDVICVVCGASVRRRRVR